MVIVIAVVAALLPATAASALTRPTVVVDPDNQFAVAERGGVQYTGFPIQLDIAQSVAAELPKVCDSKVVLTREDSNQIDPSVRASQMQSADLSVTLSVNGLTGSPWGTVADGGYSAYTTTAPDNLALGTELLSQLHGFTGRPSMPVNEAPPKPGLVLPYAEFAALPSTYAQIFLGYLDHNYDFFVYQEGRELLVKAVVTAIATTLQAKGFQCLGKFPSRPSAARLQQLRNLGYQSFLRYGADPVSMSTGNFATAERIFSLSGVGQQLIDLALNYNSQSNQDSSVGFGWTFAYGSSAQQYGDGSVVVSLADGRAFLFVPDGTGGFTTPQGAFAALTQPDSSTLRWASTTGSGMTFTLDGAGRGVLQSTTDRQGNGVTLAYGGPGGLFPKLTGITDQAGQQIAVTTNGDGRITSFTRPDGALWKLGYSGAGDLTSITSARGTVRKFGYDGLHRMTSEVGQDNVTYLTNTYDASARVVKQTNAFNQLRTIAYDDASRTTTFTDTTGAVTIYRWNELGAVTQVKDAVGGTSTTVYTADLQPASQTNPLNQTTAMTYGSSGQVASVTDPLGNTTTSAYNSSGDLTSRTDKGGVGGAPRTTSFTVNPAGLPTTITNLDGSTQTRSYNAFGDVLTSSDELGATTSYGYDSRGNTRSVTDALGRVTTMTYDLANRLTSVTNQLGRTTSYSYDPNDNLTTTTYPDGSSEQRTYDVNDQLASSTDRRGAVTSYTYDAELNVVAITRPNGGVVKSTFDGEDRLTSVTDALGNKTTYQLDALGRRIAAIDPRGNTTKTIYDAAGEVRAVIDASGATTNITQDANGRPINVMDPAGGATITEWDSVGRLTAVIDQLNHRTSHTYNFRDQVLTTKDPAGGVSSNAYDKAGRNVSSTDQAGAVTKYGLDAAGQLIKLTDALGGVTMMTYDAAGNRLSVTDPNGHTDKTAYDAMNQPVSRTNGNGETRTMTRDAGGLVVDETDPLGHHTSSTYDKMGDRTTITDAVGRTTKFGYDLNGQTVNETAADGVVTARRFDKTGNLVAVVENARSGQPASTTVNVTTNATYDPRNLLASITDANGANTNYGYDVRGLPITTTDPLGKVTTVAYDKAGNRAKRTDANSVTTSYSYDPRDLLLRRAYPGGLEETFTYDKVGHQLTATSLTGTVATTYDLLGRTTKVRDAAGKTLTYSHNAGGNRTGLTLPDGQAIGYTTDAADRLTKLTSPLGEATIGRDGAGRPTNLHRPNSMTTTIGYDNADEVTQLKTTMGATELASFTYGYDLAANVASRVQKVGKESSTTTYGYDPLRRLTSSAGGPLPSTFNYDGVGNRLTWIAPDDPLTPKPNDPFKQTNVFNAGGQLTKSTIERQNGNATKTDITTNRYDNNGNRIETSTEAQSPGQSAATAYTYDFENRLRTSSPTGDRDKRGNGAGQRDYTRTYDALGRLVTETRGKTTTTWTEDGLNSILASDTDTTLYLRGAGGQLLGEQTGTGDPAWYLNDALGSVLGSVGSKAKLDNTTAYSDYGVRLQRTDLRVGFGGELSDPTLPGNGIGNDTPVLSHYYARSYDPMSGNWLQEDPIGGRLRKPSSLALHQFVADNPSSNTDLLGMLSVSTSPTWNGMLTVTDTPNWSGTLRVGSGSTATLNGPLQSSNDIGNFLQPAASGYGRRSPASKYRAAATTSWTLQGAALFAGALEGDSWADVLFGSGAPGAIFDSLGSWISASNGGFAGFLKFGTHQVAAHTWSGVQVPSYVSYNKGVGALVGGTAKDAKSIGTWLGRVSNALTVLDVALDTRDAYNESAGLPAPERASAAYLGAVDSVAEAGSGWLGAKAGAAALGAACVYAAPATAGWSVVASPGCALVGGVAGYFGGTALYREARDEIVPAYQQGVNEGLDCWPNCSNWQLTGGAVWSGLSNVWTDVIR
jgi:YD repeat-containing protein